MTLGAAIGTALLVTCASGGLTPTAAARPIVSAASESPAAVRAYWTPARMRGAEPAGVLARGPLDLGPSSGRIDGAAAKRATGQAVAIPNARRYPYRTHGKVFFTLVSGPIATDYTCSGTAVRAATRDLVWTAGHCVYDPGPLGSGPATNWEFVPGFQDGRKPYGEWPADRLSTTSQWMNSGGASGEDFAHDFGAANVATRNGRRLEDVIGARRIAFGQSRDFLYRAFGYPADPPFDGRRLYRCNSPYEGEDDGEGPPPPMQIACDMTAGASGGGWEISRRHRGRKRRYVASVTSYSIVGDSDHLYGPYQGGVARRLYRSAGG
jgi:V8-like Glu-specific endopeptidase